MTSADSSHRPDGRAGGRAPARVDSSTRVNVALPFSQFKIQEPSAHLLALTALVEDLVGLVAQAVPGPEAEALCRRAHELAGGAGRLLPAELRDRVEVDGGVAGQPVG